MTAPKDIADNKDQQEQRKAIERFLQKSIRIRVAPIEAAIEELKKLLEKEYDLVPETVEKLVENEVGPFMDHLRKDLYAVIEYPYVDKLYRDSYYIFYSSKHTHHHRDSMRVSFFSVKLEEGEFLDDYVYQEKLLKSYLGYLVLRPTFPKVIGRTAISPLALSKRNFACCVAPFSATTLSDKFQIHTFPHTSQDSHTITCAETTIWGIMEYFSSKYPEYKPVLPSHISKIIQKISFKRTFPSEGLTAEQVTYAIRELGFGAMIYSRKKHRHIFNTLVSIYIESGIPVIGVLKDVNGRIGHAVNIIGREIPDTSAVAASAHHENTEQGGELIDFSQIDRNYVFMDDNFPPFQLGPLDYPCQKYFKDKDQLEKWQNVNLTHIIVPLYSKIYLDAARARKNFLQIFNSAGLKDEFGISVNGRHVIRIFLASSRSFKQHISLYTYLPDREKVLLLGVPLPKFIWVAELSSPDAFAANKCDGFFVQDATEPGEFSGKSQAFMHSLILGIFNNVIFRQDFGKFISIKVNFAHPFNRYISNLSEFQ